MLMLVGGSHVQVPRPGHAVRERDRRPRHASASPLVAGWVARIGIRDRVVRHVARVGLRRDVHLGRVRAVRIRVVALALDVAARGSGPCDEQDRD